MGCHSVTAHGVIFHGWPDGKPYLDQEVVVTEVFNIFRDEAAQVHADMIKKLKHPKRRF